MSPLIDQICIHGDSNQMTCIALIVPNQKNLIEMAEKMGIKDVPFDELCENTAVEKEVLKQVTSLAQKCK